ncbi:Uncharacterised protein [Vibrio cholerae]|uniref:Uncharacterized protein n=1 Tax=Vibrio cholerae TaxID=666 RepID=A0A656AZE8_VIBCL|nr:Uncharacterised protein [Vibrio cholerae]
MFTSRRKSKSQRSLTKGAAHFAAAEKRMRGTQVRQNFLTSVAKLAIKSIGFKGRGV